MAGVRRLACLLIVLVLAACDEDPFTIIWAASPDTAEVYSLARPELDLFSAFSFVQRTPVRIERSGAAELWDVAVDTRAEGLVLLPPGALGISSRARVTELAGLAFADVLEAPQDTLLYTASEAVQLRLNSTYIVRTGARGQAFGTPCSFYAKLEPLVIDVPSGLVRFVFDASPSCNDRSLVPPGGS